MIRPFSEDVSLLPSDQSKKALQEAKAFIDGNLQQTIRDVVSDGEQGQLVVHTDLERAVKDAWIVTECVPEIEGVKMNVLGKPGLATTARRHPSHEQQLVYGK